MNVSFKEEVAVVVGAASGIGKATAEKFEADGARVVRFDLALMEGEDRHQVDATDLSRLMMLATELQSKFNRIDHLVVSVGMSSGTLGFPFWNVAPSAWASVLDVNLIAPVNVAHAFVPLMLPRQRGTFCFVTSVAGQIGSQTDPPYSAAKAGLINFTQCAAKDLASYNIRVNAVSPGMVKTPLNRSVWQAWRESSAENQLDYDAWAEQKIKQVAPLGRWQTDADIANAICFLASDLAQNMTGQTLNVDGGQVMHA